MVIHVGEANGIRAFYLPLILSLSVYLQSEMQRAARRRAPPIFSECALAFCRYEKFARSNEQSKFVAREKALTGVGSKNSCFPVGRDTPARPFGGRGKNIKKTHVAQNVGQCLSKKSATDTRALSA